MNRYYRPQGERAAEKRPLNANSSPLGNNHQSSDMSLSDKLYRTPAVYVAAASAVAGAVFCLILALVFILFGLRITKNVDLHGREVGYFGFTAKGEPTLGRLFFPEGESAFVFGGSIRYSNGSVYKGSTDGGILPHGQGTLTDPDGNVYSGNFVDGVLEGKGSVAYADGSSFSGEFYRGKMDGYGEFIGADGSSYKGYYSEGEESGEGIMVYADGSSYRGQFQNGMRHGQGSYQFYSGDYYTGEFRNNTVWGRGSYFFASGHVITGEFRNGIPVIE